MRVLTWDRDHLDHPNEQDNQDHHGHHDHRGVHDSGGLEGGQLGNDRVDMKIA